MVEKIAPTSPTAASSATHVNQSTSIGSEPDNAWVAERQAKISAGSGKKDDHRTAVSNEDRIDSDDDPAAERHLDHHSTHPHAESSDPTEERLSGESERIGTGTLDEDVPFGKHVGYL